MGSLRTARMLERTKDHPNSLSLRAIFFHSYALETGIFAAASAERAVYNTLVALMQPRNSDWDMASAPAREYNHQGGTVKFWDLWTRARERDELLIGWSRTINGGQTILELNPARHEAVELQPSDALVMLKRRRNDHFTC